MRDHTLPARTGRVIRKLGLKRACRILQCHPSAAMRFALEAGHAAGTEALIQLHISEAEALLSGERRAA